MPRLRLCYLGPAESITLRRWVEWFGARGHETTVVTVEPAAAPGFRQIDVRRGGPWRKAARLRSACAAARVVRELRPDVVHVHYLRGLAWGLALYPFSPMVVTPWGSDVLEEQGAFREPYARPLTRRLLRLASLITVHSSYMAERVRRLVGEPRRLECVGWGVDVRAFRGGLDTRLLRARHGIGEDRQVIFSPRLAQPLYRHEHVLRALPQVRRACPRALLAISGSHADEVYLGGLKRLAAELGVEDAVLFLAPIPYDEMPLWFNLAEAVVMVPRSDGMPNSLLEAMACEAVPVLQRLPQYDELVRDQEHGFLIDGEAELAAALVAILGDRQRRTEMGRRNRQRACALADQDREMARMEQWYETLGRVRPTESARTAPFGGQVR